MQIAEVATHLLEDVLAAARYTPGYFFGRGLRKCLRASPMDVIGAVAGSHVADGASRAGRALQRGFLVVKSSHMK